MEKTEMLPKNYFPVSNICARCSKYGNFACERCDEPYCSRMCQVQDWREHRRYCSTIPRLVARTDQNASLYPMNRMLMDAHGGFDATDAIGSISESSIQGDVPMDPHQVVKLAKTLNKMQIETKKLDLNSNISEIGEVLSTPPSTPIKSKSITNEKIQENANHKQVPVTKVPDTTKMPEPMKIEESPKIVKPVKDEEPPKQRLVFSPPVKQKAVYKPSTSVIQAKTKVCIVHVENHKTVFVVPCNQIEQWEELIKKSNAYAQTAKVLKNPPESGYIVLAKAKNCNDYGRCLVKRIRQQDQIAKVEFIEYGFTDIINFSEMKCLSEDLVNAPRLVNMVTLKGIPDEMEHAQEVQRVLIDLQENRTELIVADLQPVEITANFAEFNAKLVDGTKFEEINKKLKDLVAVEVEEKIEIDDFPEPPQKSEIVDMVEYVGFSGENLELYILDNSFLAIGCFSAIKVSDMALLGTNDEICNKYCGDLEKAPDFYPRNNELCLAQSLEDKRWYRANCQEKVDKNTYNLMYIDYGNMEHVTVDRIRELTPDYAFPCITVLCFLEGLNDKLSDRALERLKQLIPQYSEATFDSVTYTGEDAVCKSSKIMNTLKQEGLI